MMKKVTNGDIEEHFWMTNSAFDLGISKGYNTILHSF